MEIYIGARQRFWNSIYTSQPLVEKSLGSPLTVQHFYVSLMETPLFKRLYNNFYLSITFSNNEKQKCVYNSIYFNSEEGKSYASMKFPVAKSEYPFSVASALYQLTPCVAASENHWQKGQPTRPIGKYDWLIANTFLQLVRCQYGEGSQAEINLVGKYISNGVKYTTPRKHVVSNEGHLKLIENGKRMAEFRKLQKTYAEF